MAAPGRPISNPDATFYDRPSDEFRNPEANPYLDLHRSFGRPLLPAAELQAHRGRMSELFGREAPMILEIGAGNGEFMAQWGVENPQYNYLGIEIRYKRTVLCARKVRAANAQHVLIARYHAAFLRDLFGPGELSGLWVNHPDPWPKERHEKNRLISRWFLEDVAYLLRSGGFLRIKSDFAPNCERVEHLLDHGPEDEPLERLPLDIIGRSSDVNAAGAPWSGDVRTNYQGKMLVKGVPVHAIEVIRR